MNDSRFPTNLHFNPSVLCEESNLAGSSLAASLLLSTYRNFPRKKSPAFTALREKTFSEQYFGLSMEQILKQKIGLSQTTNRYSDIARRINMDSETG